MCLGVPGRVVRWIEREGPMARADIEFAGVQRLCYMACVNHVVEGEYVLVHAGIAIGRLNDREAERLIEELNQLPDPNEWVSNGRFDDAEASKNIEYPS